MELGGTRVGVCGAASLQRQHTQRASDRPSAVKERTVRPTKSRNILILYKKLFSLLHSSKLIFQAFKNHANFCVDTRNQEQPILLGICRKAIVDLK